MMESRASLFFSETLRVVPAVTNNGVECSIIGDAVSASEVGRQRARVRRFHTRPVGDCVSPGQLQLHHRASSRRKIRREDAKRFLERHDRRAHQKGKLRTRDSQRQLYADGPVSVRLSVCLSLSIDSSSDGRVCC